MPDITYNKKTISDLVFAIDDAHRILQLIQGLEYALNEIQKDTSILAVASERKFQNLLLMLDESIKDSKRTNLSMISHNPNTQYTLGILEQHMGDFPEAKELVKEIYEALPETNPENIESVVQPQTHQ